VQKCKTLYDPERSKCICNHRLPKRNLLQAQRSVCVSSTDLLVICCIDGIWGNVFDCMHRFKIQCIFIVK